MGTEREFFLPEPGAPHWLGSASPSCDLLYLAWGRRYYGRHPIPVRLHHGWSYMVVLRGNPTLVAGSRTIVTQPGTLILAGPDVPYGWTDRKNRISSLLVWVWAPPPGLGRAAKPTTCRIRLAGAEGLGNLGELHLLTRREVQSPDEISPAVLTALRQLVESAFARHGRTGASDKARDEHRMQLAEQWMNRHLHVHSLGGALADYLGMTSASLHRLFRRLLGRPPARVFLEAKMREACRLITAGGRPVKEAGLALGYRHPGDFTRAFTRFHGYPPSRLTQPPPRTANGR